MDVITNEQTVKIMKSAPLMLAISLSLIANQEVEAVTNHHYKPQLAVSFDDAEINDWTHYYYSEKLDGIRAYWDGQSLFTRQGKQIFAPTWFVDAFPDIPLEGELWIGRNQFEATMAVVMDSKPDDEAWKQVRFMVFDMPASIDRFEKRYSDFKSLILNIDIPHLGYVEHYPVEGEVALKEILNAVDSVGGEGLMLRKLSGVYTAGRSDNVLKMKVADDAEAEVVGYVGGKGKHQGRMGSLVVRMPDGKEFKIGTGFSDKQRENPPALGVKITYRHNGFTHNGVPKFARFVRVDASKQ
ncbi:DNA ligase [Grimontia hollisae]|uniref:DNA ligase n=2 Tax=Grimontia hollisae TaxID=673 RepID=A0A377HMA7_GRIHO|nr:DNA ligase [Grimontia hollisae]STQ75243.1 DNA ligase [Grimontia hollisae]